MRNWRTTVMWWYSPFKRKVEEVFGRWFLSLTRESKKAPHFCWKKNPPSKKYSDLAAKAKHEKSVFKKRPDPRWAVYLKSSKKGGPKTVQESVQDLRLPRFERTINPSPECPTFSDLILSKLNWVLQSLTKIKVLQKVFFFAFVLVVLGSTN